jgi:tetratricopeptide (TPR) repeat protein
LNSTVYRAYTNLHIGDYELGYLQARQFFDDNPHINYGSIEGIGLHVLGCSALVVADYEEALDRCHQAVECFRERPSVPVWSTLSLTAYTIAAELGGDEAAAKGHLLEVLQIASRVKLPNVFLLILPPAALLAADMGEVERAIELYEMACQHPFVANSHWYKDVVGKRLGEMAKGLSPEVVEAARQRGKERDPGETARELLAEFEALEKE